MLFIKAYGSAAAAAAGAVLLLSAANAVAQDVRAVAETNGQLGVAYSQTDFYFAELPTFLAPPEVANYSAGTSAQLNFPIWNWLGGSLRADAGRSKIKVEFPA